MGIWPSQRSKGQVPAGVEEMPLAVIKAVVQLPDGVDMLEDDDVPWVRMLLVHVKHDVN